MNLHAIVAPYIGAVNPHVALTVIRATGYTIADDGTQLPSYDTWSVSGQVQALSFSDLQKLDGMNIQGVRRAVYVSGVVAGAIRAQQRGGDLIQFPAGTLPEGDNWLCVMVLEQWPDWCKFAITLQDQ